MKVPQEDIYEKVNREALAAYPGLLQTWFPNGKRRGREFVVGNLNGDAGDSLSINISTGKWSDFGTDIAGGDAISLCAAKFHGGTGKTARIEACKHLAEELGVGDDAPAPRKARPKLTVVSSEEWTSMIPPPPDAGLPDMSRAVAKFTYLSPDNVPLRYTARYERADGTKYFIPHTYGYLKDEKHPNGETGWHGKHPNEPLCLYGLHRLGGKPVLLQEGEQKSDDVQGLLPGWACLGWSGGAGRARDHDYSPLTRDPVYVCGDAVDGFQGMMDAADCIHRLGVPVWTIDLSDFPKGWDLGNACSGKMVKKGKLVWESETGPWSAKDIEGFIRERARLYDPDPGNVDSLNLEQPSDDDAPWKDDSSTPNKRTLPPIPLGYDSGYYYYLSPMTGQIEALARRAHTKTELVGIASLQWYNRLEQCKGDKGGLDWDKIGDLLKGWCSDVGFYDPDKARGRGAWLDEDRNGTVRAVLNLGSRLIVDGETHPLLLPGSKYVYEAARPLKVVVAEPLTREQAAEVLEICKLFSWEKEIYGTFMAGWIMTAAICGALNWRPAVWVTGGSGSGKSTLEKLVVKRLLGAIGLFKKGGTTEAGIRQELKRDARPVILDETESETAKAKATNQGLLDLNRQSSSEGGAQITKGTQNQTGAITFHVRSSFLFSSINPMLEHLADESRVTVVELKGHDAEARAGFADFVRRIDQTLTEAFAAGFIARAVKLMPVIRENAETFSRAVAVELGSARVGDQIGTLLAGAYACKRDGLVSFDAALRWVRKLKRQAVWDGTTSANAVKDEERLTLLLFQQRIKIDLGDKVIERTVGEAMEEAAADTGTDSVADILAATYQNALRRYGLKVEDGGVWISNTHKEIKGWLKDTPWSSQWSRSLKRIPGAKSSDPRVIVFSKWDKTKAVWLPFAAFEG